MVSKNNQYWKQQQEAQRVPHYGLRKLSIGVASVLLSTTLYMGVTAHADTVTTPSEQPAVSQPTSATTDTSTGSITVEAQPTADKTANSATSENDVSAKPVQTVSPEQPANTTDSQPTEATNVAQPAKNLNVESDNNGSASESTGQSVDSTALMTNFAVTNQPTDGTHNSDTTTLNTTFKWSIHYTDETGKKLLPDSVITHDYTRTDTGNQMGNWSYVPDSVKVTGTPNNGWHIDNPNFKFDQAAGGTTFDFATWQAAAASIDGYTPNYGSVALTDQLPKNPESLHATETVDSGTHEFTFVYTQQPKTVKINYVNDDDNENVVKTDSVSGKLNTAVTITPNLPSGYMLTPGKDVPSTYTLTDANNQAVTIHVQKQFVDVSDTDPQAKQTRTITLHYVYDGGSKDDQKAFDDAVLNVYYHRTATLDRATNQTTYGDWMWDQSQGGSSTPGYHVVSGKWTSLPQTWANVAADVPSIKGYYADLGQNDPTNTNHIPSNTWVFPTYNNSLGGGISEGGKGATAYLDGYGYEVNPTHTIKYMPNKTTVTVNYVDDDNNKANVGSQHWDGTTGQHIDLILTPPANYVLSPGWVNPSSYDFDGVNSSWFTVHVKHATQDVTDQQSKDQISKTETLTRKHLYGPGPHEGEKFGESDILEVPWHRTATKDLVTNKVSFGDWHVIWDEVKQLSGATKMWGDSEHHWVNGGLIAGHSGYSYLGLGSKSEAITTDGKVSGHGWYWMGEQDIENNPTIVQYYGREKVGVPVNYVDFDTNEQLTTKWLTGDNYLDGNTITFNKSDLTDWGKAVSNDYQLYTKQTLPTTYKIDTVSNDGNLTPITVYVVQPRTVQFTFADNDSTVNGQHPQVGDAVSVTGITGSTTSVNLTIPAGYKLANGQQLPTTYTFVKGEQNQVILLTHQHVTVQPDAPKTPNDKLPDNPSKSYPSGVAKDDLTKTVTRKVTITSPDGKSTVTNQTVTFTRNATVDEVTGNVTYGSWSENGKHEFATVEVPNVPGYTATGDIPDLTVTPDSKDTDVTIDYTANQQNTQIVFVDKDGKTIDTVDVNGKTGETVETNAKVPDKWKLVDNETVPSTITFSADTPDKITVHVEHKIETKQLKVDTNVFLPRLIKAGYGDLFDNQGYTLWINDDEFNSKEYWFGKPVDVGSVTGSVQYDLVSGKIVKVNNGETLKLGKTLLHYPSDDDVANGGYLNDAAVYDGVKKTFTDELNEITHENLNYKVYASANLTKDLLADKDGVISHYFVHDNEILPFTFKNGKQYGSDYEIDTSTIDNSFSISFNDLIKNIEAFDINENDDGSLSTNAQLVTPIAYQPYIGKTVTRTINVTSPDKTVKTIKQTAEINQNVGGDYDWKVHHGDYLRKGETYVTDNNWSAYEVPTINGYTASQNIVNAVSVDGNTTDQTVNISYTANKQSVNVNYVDVNDGNKVVHTTTVNGVTDGDTNVPNELPAGYKLVDGQSVPQTIHFNANNNDDINVKVQHSTVTVTPDSPKTSNDKLPDNPSKNYPSGVAKDDLSKTVTRKVTITTPDGKQTVTNQIVTFTRNATVDEVTGHVTYGSWSENGKHTFVTVDVPNVPGYTATGEVPNLTVTPDSQDTTVTIGYTANKQQININYVDVNDGNKVVHTTTVNGVTDGDTTVSNELPAGYKLVDGQSIPKTIHFNADNNDDINIKVQHTTVTVTPDSPKTPSDKLPDNPNKSYPSGVSENDLNKTITRTIKATTPDGQTKTVEQTVHLTRTADVDEVTGEVTYGKWSTGQWPTYDVPTVPGYTASQPSVEITPVNENTKDQTVDINYTANGQTTHINYIDDAGKIVHTTTITGKTGETVNLNLTVPDKYQLADGQQLPTTYTFTADSGDVTIRLAHKVVQREAAIDVQIGLVTLVDLDDESEPGIVVTQNQWTQLDDEIKKSYTTHLEKVDPTVGVVGTLTGHVNYDLVDNKVVSFADDWTSLNLGGQTYQMPDGTDVVNGMVLNSTVVWGKKLKELFLKGYPDTDPDYVNRAWHGYLSVNKSNIDPDYAGCRLVGNEPNALAKATDDRAATAIEMTNKPIDLSSLQEHDMFGGLSDFNEQDGQLQAKATLAVGGVYIPYVEKTATRTINIVMPDGKTTTIKQTATLAKQVDSNKDDHPDWTTGEWSNYDVPMVQGYTASQSEVPTAKVIGNTKDQTVTVTYKADQQKLIVNFIDDTTGQTLKTVNKDGLTNSDSNYNTKSDIQDYVNNHYRLVSDDTNGQNLVFDNDDSKTQTYNVHLAHNMHDINDSNTVTETIHYKLDNSQKAFDDYNAQLSFTRTGYNDEVTGQNHWNDWQAINGQTFNAVQSPSKEGYTPDKTSIEAVNVNPGNKNIDITVTYNANAQVAKISYIDDTTGRTLKIDNANGKFNQAINFDNNVDNQIKNYEQQGYVLKSNSFSNQAYQADNAKNAFEVHLVHGTKNVQRTQKITETVQYQMEDGTKAPVTNTQSVDFTQDGVQDLVTKDINWKATAPQQFKAVDMPTLTGYTPDIASVPATTVNFGDKNINKTVTYKANAQMAKISYIDDNTGATLKTDNANGKFNQTISFGDVDGVIKGFEDKGYQLKSNGFKGQSYQADNTSNVFEVHLVHGTKNVQRTQKITETVNYQMDDGSKAPAANTQSVDFTQDGVQDLVTKDIDWKATAPQQFKAVDTPTVTGYTPDIASVPATTVNFGDKDINKLVTYKANVQNATINYIDDTTGKTIKTDNANGKFNQSISFDNNVDNQIKAFENQGYFLKSNSFNDQKYQADNNQNMFEVHLVHGTKNVQRTQKITETVNYQMDDGSEAPVTNTQSVDFTQDGVQDLVTNNIDWKATEPQQFKAVDMPTLTGYTPDITNVPATTVNFGDKDINKTVTYKANPQSAKITYIDDNTGETLKVDNANGKFNQVIDFANMNSGIKDFENQGYVLKSNSFNGQKYQADNANNTFEVHFTHGTKNVQRQNTITETVKYQYDNGTPAHENNVQTLNFIQDGVQDLVTKNIDWKPTDAQEFKQVDTPAMDGYTPDITSIAATKVNFGDSDINKVVTYQANNQTANIHYVDDMTGSFIGNDTANGKFGTVIDFGNVNDKINTFKNLGYQLVSNGFNGQTYQSDNSKNVYYVHFTHGMKNVQRNKQITETIKYQYENGQQAQPDSVQTVSFNENGSQDLVTKKINWFNDTPQQFKAVSTPVITGYTADIDNIPAVVVNYDNDNINKVVTYKANSQTAKINYIDDTTGKVIKTDTANGKFNQAISFSETPTNVINDLIKRGYKLVSNSFNGQTYQNDNSKNEFTVHLAHNTKNVSKQNTVTRTINYLDNNGQAIQAPIIETVTFTQNGTTDLVTGNTTWNTPSSQTFETVKSLTIKGFGKPDVEVVQPQTVNFKDQNMVVNVHYPKATTPTNVNDNTGQKVNDNTPTPTVDHNKGKLNPTTFTTNTHQTTPQAHTANNGGQQSITPQSINKPSEQQTVANNGTKANTLPQTGNSNNNGTAMIGLGLLSGMFGLLGIKGKKKQD